MSLKVSMESPQSGFMSMSLSSGEEKLVMAASCQPYDSIVELIGALSRILQQETSQIVKWNCEPEEFDFNLTSTNDLVKLEVIRYPNHRRRTGSRVFLLSSPKLDLCITFWSALRDLRRNRQVDVFDKNWRRPFPDEELREFTKLIRGAKRQARAG